MIKVKPFLVDSVEQGMVYLSAMTWIPTQKACDILGVHKNTLYRWGDQGKVKVKREPLSNYRKFDLDEIEKLSGKVPKKWIRGTSKIAKALDKKKK